MKKFLYVILALIALYLILALFGKSVVVVERSITVNKPAGAVKNLLGRHEFFHSKWSPWTEKDPGMEVKFSGNPGEVGHTMEWSSKVKDVGSGTLQIVGVSDDSLVQKLTFEGMGDSKAYYIVKENEGGTGVTWGMEMKTPFLFRPMMMFMDMDKMIGADYEKGLASFKKAAEEASDEKTSAYEVIEMEWPESNFVGSKREVVAVADMEAFFGKHFSALGEALGKEKIQPEAAPMALYWAFDEKEMKGDMAAVFKVAPGVKLKGFENYTFPASKVLKVEYYGNYDKTGDAHYAIDAYMKEKGLAQSEGVFEEYVTDPGSEKDTSKWLTNIYYLVK